MSRIVFHLYNIMILIGLIAFNALALFGAGMSQGGIYPYMWFVTGSSFIIWLLFYIIQFQRPERAWRITWALSMLIFLFFWETGFGVYVTRWIPGL